METRDVDRKGVGPGDVARVGAGETCEANLSPHELGVAIVELTGRLSAGTYELLCLVGELDASGAWAGWGALSCAAWLADACDIERSTAHNQVRVARAMRRHAGLAAAMADGEVSYAKARVLAPYLTSDNESVLVDLARRTPASRLGAAIAAWAAEHEDPAERHHRHRATRSTAWRCDPDGMVTITARLAPERAAAVCAEIDRRVRASRAPAGATLVQQRADALCDAVVGGGGGGSVAEVVVHVRGRDAATLADGTPLDDHAVIGLLDDGFVSLLIHDMEGRAIDASPRRRSPTRRQRRVIDQWQTQCAHPGCSATELLQYDHARRYTDDGPTTLDNLQRLCGPHNRAKEAKQAKEATTGTASRTAGEAEETC